MTYISWFSDIGLYLEDYFMYKAVTLAGGIREPLLTCTSCACVYVSVWICQGHNLNIFAWILELLARLDEVQEELLYYRRRWRRYKQNVKSFYVKVFYVMAKALSGELSCPCDRSCFNTAVLLEE